MEGCWVKGNEIALILTALGSLLTGLAMSLRGLRTDKQKAKRDESSDLLAGYTSMITALRQDLETARDNHTEETDRLHRQYGEEIAMRQKLCDQDRAIWENERRRLEERIETLEAQVVALMNRPIGTRTRKTDRET